MQYMELSVQNKFSQEKVVQLTELKALTDGPRVKGN